MNLDVMDRLMLLGLLPAEGNLRTMRIVQELRRDLGFTTDELTAWNIVEQDGRVMWGWSEEEKAADPAKAELDMLAEIHVEGEKMTVIVEALKELDKSGKVGPQHLSLFEKFPLLKVAD